MKKEELQKILDKYNEDIENDNWDKIFNSLDDTKSDILVDFVKVLDELGIDYLSHLHTRIYRLMYYGRTDLETFTVPDGIFEIGPYAFYDCSNLKSITLPKSLIFIGFDVFNNCDKLEEINFKGTKAEWNDIEIRVNPKFKLIRCTDGEILDESLFTLDDMAKHNKNWNNKHPHSLPQTGLTGGGEGGAGSAE